MASTTVVTGGQGFFGAWIVKQLLADGEKVVVFDVKEDNNIFAQVLSDAEIASVQRVYGDVGDTETVKQVVLAAKPTAIIHLAGLQIPTCKANPVLGAKVNVIGTINIFEAAKALGEQTGQAPVVVYASSAAILGPRSDYDPAHLPLPDDYPHKPTTIYGIFKQCNEGTGRIYHADHKIRSVGLRPYTCYGVGREFGLTSAPTKALKAAILGRDYHIPFAGLTGFSYVEDIAKIFIGCARAQFDGALVFNIRGDVITVEEFIKIANEAVPETRGRITCAGNELAIMADVDESKLKQLIHTVQPPLFPGEAITTPIGEAVARMAAVYRALHAQGKLNDKDL